MEDIWMLDHQYEIENRIKNLVWTVSKDYTLSIKPDVDSYYRSPSIAFYDGIKQGAFARYFDREALSLYILKKMYYEALEGPLMTIVQLCIDEAIFQKIDQERAGVGEIRQSAYEAVLDTEFANLSATPLGHLKIALFREYLDGAYKSRQEIQNWADLVHTLRDAQDTMDIIRVADQLYNEIVEPKFASEKASLDEVLAVTLEELAEFSWKDYLSEEAYENTLETYLEKVAENVTHLDLEQMEKKAEDAPNQDGQRKIVVVDQEALEKMYTYVQRNYGLSYLTAPEAKRINEQICRGIHGDCSLYFTKGILKNPAMRNYQYEYAKKMKDKNLYEYYDNHRIVKRNIALLSDMLRRAFAMRSETQEVLSDRGNIIPAALWKVGRSRDPKVFKREMHQDAMDFVVDILIDASGSQRSRQGKVALQAYMISEALSNVGILHRVMSFCTFWDYTILQQFRDYEDDRKENANIFEYITSSNNRDGLAIRAASQALLQREEEQKVLIVLSDGRPYDVVINRPNARNPQPYFGDYAVLDTGHEVRKLRNQGVSVLGVFAGEEKDLDTEKKIFGKDFAYIRDISNFSNVVGRYLLKHLEDD
ncbi:MAG: cobaltochelatase CobT-related protein [Lachnospiraceae bacterium]